MHDSGRKRKKHSLSLIFITLKKNINYCLSLFLHILDKSNHSSSFKKVKTMVKDDLKSDVYKAMCAAAWIMFFLILKNIVLLIVLLIQRRKNTAYKIPEDVNTFRAAQQVQNIEDWSLAGRIQRILANDVEYMPYFFILLLVIFCRIDLIGQDNHHYLARVLIYGLLFTIGRYLHTISYLIRNTYGRILGFLITIIVLFVISIDHIYYMTKGLHNLTRKPLDEK